MDFPSGQQNGLGMVYWVFWTPHSISHIPPGPNMPLPNAVPLNLGWGGGEAGQSESPKPRGKHGTYPRTFYSVIWQGVGGGSAVISQINLNIVCRRMAHPHAL